MANYSCGLLLNSGFLLAISRNRQYVETPKRGQSAQCPDRLITKKAADSSSIFLGVTPAPQYSLNLTTNNLPVKPTGFSD